MRLSDIMTRDVEYVRANTSLQEAAQRMKDLDVGMLPVVEAERLVGIVTDRDMTIRATAEGMNPQTTTVKEAMTTEPIYCFEDDDVARAAQVMQDRQIRRLPIVNRAKELVGVISLGDLAVHGGDERLAGEVLERVSEPAEPIRY
jgi:CBS domain-containing protein